MVAEGLTIVIDVQTMYPFQKFRSQVPDSWASHKPKGLERLDTNRRLNLRDFRGEQSPKDLKKRD